MPFTYLITLLTHYKYFLLFPALVVEGPTFTILAAFLASPGGGQVMSLPLVAIVVVVADITGDTIYYCIGRWGKNFFLNRYPKPFSISPQRLQKIQDYYRSHGSKTLVAGKLTHSLGWPAMVAAGSAHMPYGRFITVNTLVSIGKSAVLISLGYFYGKNYDALIQYVGKTAVLIATGIFIIVVFLLLKRSKKEIGTSSE